MQRLTTSLATLIALMAIAPAAEAGSYSFSIGGHRFHVEAPRHCRSASCVSVSSNRSIRPTEDGGATSAPAPVAQAPQRVDPAAPVRPSQAVAPPPTVPVVAATTSQPVVLPPAPRLEPPRLEALSPNPPRVELPRVNPPMTADAPTEASNRGESVLVNMKPKSHDAWTGSIYSRSSGNTYYATMTLKSSGRLHVEACALGRFWCSGNDWTRVEEQRDKLITTSRQWSARS